MTCERGTSSPGLPCGRAARVVCASVLLGALSAFAQSSLVPTPGLKIGDGQLHASVDAQARYDSLVGYFTKDASGALQPTADIVVHVRPALKFDLETPMTKVLASASGEVLAGTGILARSSTLPARVHGMAGLEAAFNRDGAVEFQFGDNFSRNDKPQNLAVGVGVYSLYNNLYAALPIHPGGKALTITPRVSWGVEFFDPLLTGTVSGCSGTDITCNPALVGRMNYSNVNFALGGRWKFLPKTAVVLDTNFDWRTYFDKAAGNPEGFVLRAQAGLAGLISQHFAVTLMAGYGGSFSPVAPANAFIANAEISYLFAADSKLALSYVRSLQPVPVYGLYLSDGGRLNARWALWGGRLALTGGASVDALAFQGTRTRHDLVIGGNVGPSVDVTSWLQLGALYSVSTRSSSAVTTAASVNYLRHEALLRLTLRY